MLYEVITTIAILAENLYEDLELWYPLMRLREEDATVEVIGTGKPTYTSKHGYPVDTTRITSYNVCYTKLLRV